MIPDGYETAHRGVGAAWQVLKIVLAALIAYGIWRSYQNPDLLLDLSSWRLC